MAGEASKTAIVVFGGNVGAVHPQTVVAGDWYTVPADGAAPKISTDETYDRIFAVIASDGGKAESLSPFLHHLLHRLAHKGQLAIRTLTKQTRVQRTVYDLRRRRRSLLDDHAIGLVPPPHVTWHYLVPRSPGYNFSLSTRVPTIVVDELQDGVRRVRASSGFVASTAEHAWVNGHMPRHDAAMYELVADAACSFPEGQPLVRLHYRGEFHAEFFAASSLDSQRDEPVKGWLVEPIERLRAALDLFGTVRLQRFDRKNKGAGAPRWRYPSLPERTTSDHSVDSSPHTPSGRSRSARRAIQKAARRSEIRNAERFNGPLTPASGAGPEKGDYRLDDGTMGENKFTRHADHRVWLADLGKLCRAARREGVPPQVTVELGGLRRLFDMNTFVLTPVTNSPRSPSTIGCAHKSFVLHGGLADRLGAGDELVLHLQRAGEFDIPEFWHLKWAPNDHGKRQGHEQDE